LVAGVTPSLGQWQSVVTTQLIPAFPVPRALLAPATTSSDRTSSMYSVRRRALAEPARETATRFGASPGLSSVQKRLTNLPLQMPPWLMVDSARCISISDMMLLCLAHERGRAMYTVTYNGRTRQRGATHARAPRIRSAADARRPARATRRARTDPPTIRPTNVSGIRMHVPRLK
jgi:hypothetical protein